MIAGQRSIGSTHDDPRGAGDRWQPWHRGRLRPGARGGRRHRRRGLARRRRAGRAAGRRHGRHRPRVGRGRVQVGRSRSRTGRGAGVERRHHARHVGAHHAGGRLQRGARHQPHRRLPGRQAGGEGDAPAPPRTAHFHRVGVGAHRLAGPGQLCGLEGGSGRARPLARSRTRLAQHHRERRLARAPSTPT